MWKWNSKHIIGKLESLAKAENKTMITLSAIPTAMLAYYKDTDSSLHRIVVFKPETWRSMLKVN
jgi:hypothetical protein